MSWKRALAVTGLIPVVVAVLLGAAWGIDEWVHRDRVPRNLTIGDTAIGSMQRDELASIVERMAVDVAALPVAIEVPDLTITTTAAEVGIIIDHDATIAKALARRGSGPLGRLSEWMGSFTETRNSPVVYTLDAERATGFVVDHPQRIWREPVEPSFVAEGADLVVQPPVPGLYLDAADAVRALWEAVDAGPPFEVDVAWAERAPRIGQADLDAALAEADRLASRVAVTVGGQPALLGAETIRRWLLSEELDGDSLGVTIDTAAAQESLERLLADLAIPGTPPVFTVEDGVVEYELGEPAMTCCAPGAAATLLQALQSGETAVDLPMRLAQPDGGIAAAEALGIKQVVGEFTTFHSCCQSRVDNIHTIADIVRGQIIHPGGSFSINDFVGVRTRDKGFVSAGVIQNGHFDDGVGGGISQFATTLFNAAFLAGLDIDEYQSHSIYISRYPYGREATLSYPAPDLRISNPTPFAVLIWPTYDDTSVTVQLYSTPYYEVEQSGQRSYKIGACTRVDTYRTRVKPDRTIVEDSVYATYRPGEGLDCNGNRTARP